MDADIEKTIFFMTLFLRKLGAYREYVTEFCKFHDCEMAEFRHVLKKTLVKLEGIWAESVYVITKNGVKIISPKEILVAASFQWRKTKKGSKYWGDVFDNMLTMERIITN